jgi:hypothetical protein
MSLENLRLLSPSMVSSKRLLRWTISFVAWENQKLELQRHDGRFECRDGKELLIYGLTLSYLPIVDYSLFTF